MNDNRPNPRLWTVEDVADYLGVPVKTLYRWRTTGYGPVGRRIGKYLRYRPQDVITGVDDLRARLLADQQACDWDLPEFVDMMMATGLRIGETSAITRPAVDLDAGTVEVRGTVIRITGTGLIIKWKPKSRAGWRKVELPSWAVVMLKKRQANATATTGTPSSPRRTACSATRATRRLTYGSSSTGRAIPASPRTPSGGRSRPSWIRPG